MSYQHRWVDGEKSELAPGKAVCVGRNYAKHARELGNPVPASPVLFIKPNTAFVDLGHPLKLPRGRGSVHHELELAVLVGAEFCDGTAAEAPGAVAGYGLALDLTLREVQGELKEKGHPWELAKAFDGSCPLSPFVSADNVADPTGFRFQLSVNGVVRQSGRSADMITGVFELMSFASRHFTLLPGDVLLTGTPDGVGPLSAEDQLTLILQLEDEAGSLNHEFNGSVA